MRLAIVVSLALALFVALGVWKYYPVAGSEVAEENETNQLRGVIEVAAAIEEDETQEEEENDAFETLGGTKKSKTRSPLHKKVKKHPQVVTSTAPGSVCNYLCHPATGFKAASLYQGKKLTAGQSINANDGQCGLQAVMQGDGNFVLYGADGHAFWSTNTEGQGGTWITMQTDGNLVIYTASNAPVWSTNTGGRSDGPFDLVLQGNHDLAIYNKANQVVWHANTLVPKCKCNYGCHPSANGLTGSLGNNQQLMAGQSITSNDGQCGLTAVMQTDGNFVLYGSDGHAFWSSNTEGKGGNRVVMQGDGNLVIYTASNQPVWAINGGGMSSQAPFTLYMQTDHNLVVYNSAGTAIWASNTAVQVCAHGTH